uniref:Solute carrier family 16 member 14 n=1 Tax=Latimeria chalumnae TaxID=7897 RepID=H3AT46_LATCH
MAISDKGVEQVSEKLSQGKLQQLTSNPNIDGGWAWMIVLASFIIHILVMGSQMALGILYVEWLEEFDQSRGLTAWIGSLTMGITLIVGPFIGLFVNTCGCRKTTIIGGIVTAMGWVLSAYATSVYYLFVSFGVTAAGIGSGMAYLPCVVMVGQYFQKRRALAQGLSTTGSGFGTFLMTMLLKYLCSELGWRNAMFIQGAISLNVCVCGALMRPLPSGDIANNKSGVNNQKILHENDSSQSVVVSVTNSEENQNSEETQNSSKKENLETTIPDQCKDKKEIILRDLYMLNIVKKISQVTSSAKKGFWTWSLSYFGDASLFTNKVFVAFILWALFAYCSFVIPFIHFPEIVKLYGFSEQDDKFPLTSIIAIVHIFGKVILGIICDLPGISTWNIFILANFILGVCILVVPLMHTFTGLAIMCAMIGFFSGYFSIMAVVTEDLVGIKNLANAFGIIICANGISALLGPPFAGWIYDVTHHYDFSFYFCGLLYMIGIICLLLKPCLQAKRVSVKYYMKGAYF